MKTKARANNPPTQASKLHDIFVYQVGNPRDPNQGWVFNDPTYGISGEALDASAGAVVRQMVPRSGGWMRFGDGPFRGSRMTSRLVSSNNAGSWYQMRGSSQQAWLCPVLVTYYYPSPPNFLYIGQPLS